MGGKFSTQDRQLRNADKILVGKPEGKRPLGRHSIDGSIIIKLIFEKQVGEMWTGFIWLRIGTTDGLLSR
jgi:hypothetical protein